MKVKSGYWIQEIAKLDDGSYIIKETSPNKSASEAFVTARTWDELEAHLRVNFKELKDAKSFEEVK